MVDKERFEEAEAIKERYIACALLYVTPILKAQCLLLCFSAFAVSQAKEANEARANKVDEVVEDVDNGKNEKPISTDSYEKYVFHSFSVI